MGPMTEPWSQEECVILLQENLMDSAESVKFGLRIESPCLEIMIRTASIGGFKGFRYLGNEINLGSDKAKFLGIKATTCISTHVNSNFISK